MNLIALLTAATETETAILQFQLDELRSLRTRMEAIDSRATVLGEVIQSGPAIVRELRNLPPTPSKLARLVEARERVEAAVVELEQLQAELTAVSRETNTIQANMDLAEVFPAPVVFA